MPSPVLALVVFGIVVGSSVAGALVGRHLPPRRETWREPIGVLQAALLGVVALIWAFGLNMAVGRYEIRRVEMVQETNAIGTTYLRAQTLPEPARSRSLALLRRTPIWRSASRRCGQGRPRPTGSSPKAVLTATVGAGGRLAP